MHEQKSQQRQLAATAHLEAPLAIHDLDRPKNPKTRQPDNPGQAQTLSATRRA
jgi:hypothetical protein